MGVVTRRTGLSPDVLRVWERRYGAVTPTRSSGGQRIYSAADVEKLRLLRRLVEGGHRIAAVAALGVERLAELAREVELSPAVDRGDASASDEMLTGMLDATSRLDAEALESILRRGALALGAEAWIESLVAPFLVQVGDRWHSGAISPAHEHLASATVRDLLAWVVKSFAHEKEGPAILVTTPAGELHELGAMMAAAIAASVGWKVHYLGPNVPPADVARAARQLGVAAVALSVVHPDHASRSVEQVAEIRRALPRGTPIFVGGAAALESVAALTGAGATVAADPRAFRVELREITPDA